MMIHVCNRIESLFSHINNLKLGDNSNKQITKKSREGIFFGRMSIRAFSGTSRTLTGIIIENSNLSNPSLLGKLIATKIN